MPNGRLRRNTREIKSCNRKFLYGTTVACLQKERGCAVWDIQFVAVREGVRCIRTSNTTSVTVLRSVKSLCSAQPLQRMRRKPTSNPGREAGETLFKCGRMSAIQWPLIGPRTRVARLERGPAKSCVRCLSKRSPVAIFCSLFCGTSSRMSSRSKRQTTSKACAVWKVMEGNKNSRSQAGESAKRGVQLCPRASLTFSRPLRRVDEHAATR